MVISSYIAYKLINFFCTFFVVVGVINFGNAANNLSEKINIFACYLSVYANRMWKKS